MNKKFEILDCTLRDGGYYNNWDFNKNNIQQYLNLINSTEIKYVELGFRLLDDHKIKGLTAYTSESLLKSLKIPKNIKLGVMINASDFFKKKDTPLKNCKNTFKNLKKSKISFVRFACHYEEIFLLRECFDFLKKNSIKIFVNVMQISEINYKKIKAICNFLNKKIDVLYFADSLGCLKNNETKKIARFFKKNWQYDLGIHAHNNLSLALDNSITANNNGVKWIDSTITGMGRGPGNTKTEDIIKKKFGKKSSIRFKKNTTFKYFLKLKKEYSWGTNRYYELAANKKIHPTYIQKILSDKRYKKSDYLRIINSLKKTGAKKYNPYNLINSAYFLNKKIEGNWNPENKINGRDVLIIGAGESVKKNKLIIEKKINKENLFVICLNSVKNIDEKLINLRAICHPIRIISDSFFYQNSKSKIVIPYSMLNKKIKKNLKVGKERICDYGLGLNNKEEIIISNKFCSLPYPLALGYSLSVAIAGKANSILVAGFDGYKKSDIDQDETEQVFKKFISKYKKYKIFSLTNSKLNYLNMI